MSNYELHLIQERPTRNKKTGRFLKGVIPPNKGKKWSEWMSPEGQRRARKGWKNLAKYQHSPYAGKNKKEVIAVTDDGKWLFFHCMTAAGKWCGGCRENVGRCCRWNARHGKNTDYRYKGVRWYYNTDNNWTNKIEK